MESVKGVLLGIVLIGGVLIGESNAVEQVTSFGENLQPTEGSVGSVLQLISGINPPDIFPAEDCPVCECGTKNAQRIVGGEVIDPPDKYPWLAAIFHKGGLNCGGSLITDRHVVTAAHCTLHFERVFTVVYLMEYNTDIVDANVIKARVEWFYQHPKFDPKTTMNDIAVMLLDTVVPWSDKLYPICLPTPGESYDGYDGIVAGWGALAEGEPVTNLPREVTVPIMSNEDCLLDSKNTGITDDMMCAGDLDGGKDSCGGDSGGPLFVRNRDITARVVYQLAGVVSFGVGCARPDYPGVYSRVTYNLDWIRQVTVGGCYCAMPSA